MNFIKFHIIKFLNKFPMPSGTIYNYKILNQKANLKLNYTQILNLQNK